MGEQSHDTMVVKGIPSLTEIAIATFRSEAPHPHPLPFHVEHADGIPSVLEVAIEGARRIGDEIDRGGKRWEVSGIVSLNNDIAYVRADVSYLSGSENRISLVPRSMEQEFFATRNAGAKQFHAQRGPTPVEMLVSAFGEAYRESVRFSIDGMDRRCVLTGVYRASHTVRTHVVTGYTTDAPGLNLLFLGMITQPSEGRVAQGTLLEVTPKQLRLR